MTNAAAEVFRKAMEEGFGGLNKGGLIHVKEEEMEVKFRS